MTDSHLRELERRFRLSGSVEHEAAWLRARVLAGELEQSKLELAAYMAHEPARMTLGREDENLQGPFQACHGFHVFGRVATVRACVAAACGLRTERSAAPNEEWFSAALAAAEAWILGPRGKRGLRLAITRMLSPNIMHELTSPPAQALLRGLFAARDDSFRYYPCGALACGDEARVFGWMAGEVVPWALGYSDPVRERVEARERAGAPGD